MKQVCRIVLTLSMLLNSAFSYATVIATNATYGVFDGSSGTRTLSVGTHGVIDDLNLFVTFAKCGEPGIGPNGTACIARGNSYDREIAFLLTGPDGTSVRLVDFFTYTGQTPGAGRVTIRFDDQAGQVVGGSVTGGTFRPIGLLAAFNGRDMFGDYTLGIFDAASQDPLTFFSASLDVVSPDLPVDVPEPAGLALLSVGMLGMAWWRKRARI
jgi:hypothetical protein